MLYINRNEELMPAGLWEMVITGADLDANNQLETLHVVFDTFAPSIGFWSERSKRAAQPYVSPEIRIKAASINKFLLLLADCNPVDAETLLTPSKTIDESLQKLIGKHFWACVNIVILVDDQTNAVDCLPIKAVNVITNIFCPAFCDPITTGDAKPSALECVKDFIYWQGD